MEWAKAFPVRELVKRACFPRPESETDTASKLLVGTHERKGGKLAAGLSSSPPYPNGTSRNATKDSSPTRVTKVAPA